MKQYLMDELNKWQAGRDDENWNRLGKIFQERLHDCKKSLNSLVRNDDSISIKNKIIISRANCFSEIKEVLTQ